MPNGLAFPAPRSVINSRAGSRARDIISYAYNFLSELSATHIVAPSDQMPHGSSLPAWSGVSKSLEGSRAREAHGVGVQFLVVVIRDPHRRPVRPDARGGCVSGRAKAGEIIRRVPREAYTNGGEFPFSHVSVVGTGGKKAAIGTEGYAADRSLMPQRRLDFPRERVPQARHPVGAPTGEQAVARGERHAEDW